MPTGIFPLLVDESATTLIFSYVGYVSREVTIKNEETLSIVLQAETKGLNEVVVIGYGSIKKKDLTGSVAQVKPKELNAFPTGNILQALSGRATGVQVLQNDGTPGASPSIRIRGTNSILGSNEPLYVIDGFPGSANGVQASDMMG